MGGVFSSRAHKQTKNVTKEEAFAGIIVDTERRDS